MKMTETTYDELQESIANTLLNYKPEVITEHRQNVKFVKDQFIAFCWSIFNASKFDVMKLYDAGLNDSHIETALKRILSDFE